MSKERTLEQIAYAKLQKSKNDLLQAKIALDTANDINEYDEAKARVIFLEKKILNRRSELEAIKCRQAQMTD